MGLCKTSSASVCGCFRCNLMSMEKLVENHRTFPRKTILPQLQTHHLVGIYAYASCIIGDLSRCLGQCWSDCSQTTQQWCRRQSHGFGQSWSHSWHPKSQYRESR